MSDMIVSIVVRVYDCTYSMFVLILIVRIVGRIADPYVGL